MSTAASTEKDAINIMLQTISEAPINSLSGPLPTEVSMAQNFLHDTSKEVQQKGWVFNREFDYSLSPDGSSIINVPPNILQAYVPNSVCEYVQRGLKLYDRTNHTYTITAAVKANVVIYLDFNELPEVARRYILIKAARRFQAYTIGSTEIDTFTKVDEYEAMVELKRYELRVGQYNAQRNNPYIRRNYRRRPI